MRSNIIDRTGRRFGRLTVISLAGSTRNGASWLCLCDCGNYTTVPGGRLTSNNTRSCGCLGIENLAQVHRARIKDLSNQVSGWLTAIRPVANTSGRYVWLCQCKCGRTKTVDVRTFVAGKVVSCGCRRPNPSAPLISHSARARSAARNHRRRAHRQRAGGTFTKSQVLALLPLQRHRCANSACRKSIRRRYHVDHITPLALGGPNNISNIQLLCPSCNLAKSDHDPALWARSQGLLC